MADLRRRRGYLDWMRGLAVLMISSELPEILGMSDRIAVMHGGSIAGVLSRDEATQDRLMTMALGHAQV